jgi:hypothetical protein
MPVNGATHRVRRRSQRPDASTDVGRSGDQAVSGNHSPDDQMVSQNDSSDADAGPTLLMN